MAMARRPAHRKANGKQQTAPNHAGTGVATLAKVTYPPVRNPHNTGKVSDSHSPENNRVEEHGQGAARVPRGKQRTRSTTVQKERRAAHKNSLGEFQRCKGILELELLLLPVNSFQMVPMEVAQDVACFDCFCQCVARSRHACHIAMQCTVDVRWPEGEA